MQFTQDIRDRGALERLATLALLLVFGLIVLVGRWAAPMAPAGPYPVLSTFAPIHFPINPAGGPRLLSDLNQPVSLWQFTWTLAAAEDRAQLGGPSKAQALNQIRTMTAQLGRYWIPTATPPAYAPYPDSGSHTVKFYDDNAWVGLDLIQAYHLTGNRQDLLKAEAIFRYEESGWDAHGGGIYWNDQHLSRNTTANAPVAELALFLYRDTHQSRYLTWAKRIVAWEEGHLVDQNTGQVFDRVTADGQIVRHVFAYNEGTVIGGNVLLYHLTGDPQYLYQAESVAGYALGHLNHSVPQTDVQAAMQGVLADNLQLLYQVDPNPAILQAVAQMARTVSSQHFASQQLLNQSGSDRIQATHKALLHGGFLPLQL